MPQGADAAQAVGIEGAGNANSAHGHNLQSSGPWVVEFLSLGRLALRRSGLLVTLEQEPMQERPGPLAWARKKPGLGGNRDMCGPWTNRGRTRSFNKGPVPREEAAC